LKLALSYLAIGEPVPCGALRNFWDGSSSLPKTSPVVEEIRAAHGPGNVAMVEIETEHHTEVFTGFGEMAVCAEAIRTKVAQEARTYISAA
jgi:hypothetical protein